MRRRPYPRDSSPSGGSRSSIRARSWRARARLPLRGAARAPSSSAAADTAALAARRELDLAGRTRRCSPTAPTPRPQALDPQARRAAAACRCRCCGPSCDGFDVVYSAHISPYGAVPATLQRSPGTTSRSTSSTRAPSSWSCSPRPSPNYELERLRGIELRSELGREPGARLDAFVSRHGCLALDGTAVALAAIQAARPRLPGARRGRGARARAPPARSRARPRALRRVQPRPRHGPRPAAPSSTATRSR